MNTKFEINEEVDKELLSSIITPNWADMFLNWLTPSLQNRLINVAAKSNDQGLFLFLKGIQYEYGINSNTNLIKAYELYEQSSKLNESLALYRLYIINNREADRFSITRDKQMEMYLLLKALAYCDATIFFNNEILYNIDISYEIALHLDLDDPELDKVNQLFIDITPTINNDDEVKFVEACTLLKFNSTVDDIESAICMLSNLAEETYHLESIYKLACLYSKTTALCAQDKTKTFKYFKILENAKFYKAYSDYGYFLYQESRINECYEILKQGIEQGNTKCFFYYYDCSLNKLNFFDNCAQPIKELFEVLLNDIVTGNVFSFFEFFYLEKILKKHFKSDKDLDEIHKNGEELEIVISRLYKDKEFLSKNFTRDIVETEILLSLGFANYTGLYSDPDYDLAESLLRDSFKISTNLSYKRFCFSYVFKIRSKYFKAGKIAESEINETKIELYKIYNDSLVDAALSDFSSSFFYFTGKVYELGLGTKIDLLTSYCFYYQACIAQSRNLGTGSIINYFRKFKAKKKLINENFIKVSDDMELIKQLQLDLNLLTLEDLDCFICFSEIKDIIFFPCKHMICKNCHLKLKTQKCPTCRGLIMLTK